MGTQVINRPGFGGIGKVAPNSANQATNTQHSDDQDVQGQQQSNEQVAAASTQEGQQGNEVSPETNAEALSKEIAPNAPVRKNDPRTSVQKNEEYRFANNIPGDRTVPEQAYADYTLEYDDEDAVMNGKIPDVLLDVPVVKVDEINFELNDLRAQVSLHAKVLDLVELSVGADVYLGRVKLVIKGVEAQALLKVRLDNVTAILDRVLTTIDRNPQIIEKLVEGVSSAVADVGEGAGQLVGEGVNSAVEDIGAGAGDLVGEGLNSAVEDVGAGAGSAVEDIGSGAGDLVGEGLNSAVEDIGSGAGDLVGEGLNSAVEDIGSGAGDLVGEGLNS